MKTLIIGGTGFLGYHSVLECLRRGHAVSVLTLPDIALGDWFPPDVRVAYDNIFTMSDEAVHRLFPGFDALVYAVGPDDRVTPRSPAYSYYHERLVVAATRVARAAKHAGVRRFVFLGSYFATFDRLWPELGLARRHPYIRCRVEQTEALLHAGGGDMAVMGLELPYVWGAMPGRVPLWKTVLLDRIRRMPVVLYPAGGSAMISVEHAAEAIIGALEKGVGGARYPIGDVDMDWHTMLTILLQAMGLKRRIMHPPRALCSLAGRCLAAQEDSRGKESGLNMRYLFKDIMTRHLYLDSSAVVAVLGYGRGGVREAMERTVRACYGMSADHRGLAYRI